MMEKHWLERTVFTHKEDNSFVKADTCKFTEIDLDSRNAVFVGSSEYKTSLDWCTCPDF